MVINKAISNFINLNNLCFLIEIKKTNSINYYVVIRANEIKKQMDLNDNLQFKL